MFEERRGRFERNLVTLSTTLVRSATGDRVPASQLLKQPEISLSSLVAEQSVKVETDPARPDIDIQSVEVAVKYEGYLRRQEREIEAAKRHERRLIPAGFPFRRVPGLSREVIQRLEQVQPDSLAQAARIPGLTPAAVAVLAAYVGREL